MRDLSAGDFRLSQRKLDCLEIEGSLVRSVVAMSDAPLVEMFFAQIENAVKPEFLKMTGNSVLRIKVWILEAPPNE